MLIAASRPSTQLLWSCCDLVRRFTPRYHRADDEARTLVQSALANAGDIAVTATELRATFAPLSPPHRTAARHIGPPPAPRAAARCAACTGVAPLLRSCVSLNRP
jgi:hypothetical protein